MFNLDFGFALVLEPPGRLTTGSVNIVSWGSCRKLPVQKKLNSRRTRHTGLILLIISPNLTGLSAIGKLGTHDFTNEESKAQNKSRAEWVESMSSYRAAYREQHSSGPAFTKLQTITRNLTDTQIPNQTTQYASSPA